jgi:hypothetical protein
LVVTGVSDIAIAYRLEDSEHEPMLVQNAVLVKR